MRHAVGMVLRSGRQPIDQEELNQIGYLQAIKTVRRANRHGESAIGLVKQIRRDVRTVVIQKIQTAGRHRTRMVSLPFHDPDIGNGMSATPDEDDTTTELRATRSYPHLVGRAAL